MRQWQPTLLAGVAAARLSMQPPEIFRENWRRGRRSLSRQELLMTIMADGRKIEDDENDGAIGRRLHHRTIDSSCVYREKSPDAWALTFISFIAAADQRRRQAISHGTPRRDKAWIGVVKWHPPICVNPATA